MYADLNNVQITDISDMHEHCIPLDPDITLLSVLKYFHNTPGIKIA